MGAYIQWGGRVPWGGSPNGGAPCVVGLVLAGGVVPCKLDPPVRAT